MKGVRLPSRLPQRSLMMPKTGSRNRPNTLSTAMTALAMVSDMWKVPVRMSGTSPS